jgi:hypothetical protein
MTEIADEILSPAITLREFYEGKTQQTIVDGGVSYSAGDTATPSGGAVVNDNSMNGQTVYGLRLVNANLVGDTDIGNYAGGAGARWSQSAGTFDIKGGITATYGTIGGWTINATTLTSNGITLDSGNKRIFSTNYVSGISGAGFFLDSNLLEVGNIVARGLIRTAVFQKDVISTVGGNLMVLDGDVLNNDMTAND